MGGRWFKYAPLLGALFVVLTVVGFLVTGETPDSDASGAEVRDAYDDQAKHLIGTYLVILGSIALLFFSAHLRSALRFLSPGGRMGNAALAGAITAATGFLVAAVIHGALTSAVDDKLPDAAVQALNGLDNWSFPPFVAGLGTMVLATGLAIARAARLIPGWFGWLGVLIGLLMFTPAGFFGFIASGLWILALSILLYLRWEDLHRNDPDQGRPPAGAATRMPA